MEDRPEAPRETPGAASEPSAPREASGRPPQLRRSRSDKVIAGVCGGLGRHLGVDPVILRIAFVALTIAGASGVLLYVLAWIVIPEEKKGAEPAPARTDSAKTVQVIVGFTLIAIGGALLVDRFVPGLQRLVWPSILILIGATILLGGSRR